MIITASGIPVEQYNLAKEAGINCVYPCIDITAEEHSLQFLADKWQGNSVASELCIGTSYRLNGDLPISKLAALEEDCQAMREHWQKELIVPVLVSATYTRLLDHLGVQSIEEYYLRFAELAPSATPMLCHYPFHQMADDQHSNQDDLREYARNLIMMDETFDRGNWWAWVQVSQCHCYGDEWLFDNLDPAAVVYQVDKLVEAGCAGIGYYTWGPLDGCGIMDAGGTPSKHFAVIQGINQRLNEEAADANTDGN